MKYLFFVCEGMADEPLQDLGGRTPLEAAKTPAMDGLAQKGVLRAGTFVPPSLEPTPDVACLSMLGHDPAEVYTGLAPLEAAAFGINVHDHEVVFRADLVTLLDDVLMDPSSGGISEREADILLEGVAGKFSNEKFRFRRGRGYKNYLLVRDAELEDPLDELECAVPAHCVGKKASGYVLKGPAGLVMNRLAHEGSVFLESHEINRVRIDLGENPANRLWFWGQGKRPKLIPFQKKWGIDGAFYATADAVRGAALSAGLKALKSPEDGFRERDFLFFYFGEGLESRARLDLKSKVRRIEEFDIFVGHVLKAHEKETALRICVTADVTESLTDKSASHAPVPMVISGEGIAPQKHAAFTEKLCAQARLSSEKAHEFLETFLKK